MQDEKFENHEKHPSYEQVGPTAKMVAYMRVFSDIPYSEQISKLTKSEEVVGQKYGDQRESFKKRVPVLEARFKAVSQLIERVGSHTILELATGVSPRGLIMTNDPKLTYIETDLPEMLREKKDLVRDILQEQGATRPNLHFSNANALDYAQLRKAVDFTVHEITIAQEGLFVYMPRQDQKKVARNVWRILHDRGGAWITDVSLKSEMVQNSPGREAMVKTLQQETNIDLRDNAFADDAEVESFFKNAGFSIEAKINLFDIKDSLVSPSRVGLNNSQLKDILATRFIYLLRTSE